MAEWLRRWTRNPMGFPRAGSNPAGCDHFTYIPKYKIKREVIVYKVTILKLNLFARLSKTRYMKSLQLYFRIFAMNET